MSCIIDNGYSLGCASVGGVKKVYLGTYSELFTYTLDAENIVTGVATGTPTVFAFGQDQEFASLVQTGQYSRENLTVFQESVLSIKLIGWDAELRNTFNALSRAPLIAVVESNQGEFFILGVESAGRATEGTLQLGMALGDMNGSTISFTWRSANGAYSLDPAVLGTDIVIGTPAS